MATRRSIPLPPAHAMSLAVAPDALKDVLDREAQVGAELHVSASVTQARVQAIAQRVADEVERHHGEEDARRRDRHDLGRRPR